MPNLRRVLMTADTVGGVFQYALELGAGLGARGVEVTLATMGPAPSAAQRAELARVAPAVRSLHGDFKLEWMDDPWDDVDRAGEWLLDVARRTRPDVVHVNGYAHAALRFNAPIVAVAHSCVLSWWQAVHRSTPPPCFDTYRQRVADGLASADVVVAPSAAMMAEVLRYYGRLRSAAVVYNGRDPRAFAPGRKLPFVLALGRVWDEGKNLGVLDRVAAAVPWPILVGGAPPIGGTCATRFRSARYVGSLDGTKLKAVLSRAAIFAHPARYEPFGLSVLEAGLSGAALVLGDIASLREIWGDDALYVDPEDATGFGAALRRLVTDGDLRADMAARAHRRALRYTAGAMVSAYSNVYDDVLRMRRDDRPVGETCA